MGGLKSGEELVDVYIDLLNKYPRIVMFIEPFTQNDQFCWYKLQSKISNRCFVANNLRHAELVDRKSDELLNQLQEKSVPEVAKCAALVRPAHSTQPTMPVNFYKYENRTNVSNISKTLRENTADASLINGLSCGTSEHEDAFLADLVKTRFLLIFFV